MLYSRVGTGAPVRTVHLAAPAADKDQASAGAQSALTALLPSWKAAVPLPLRGGHHPTHLEDPLEDHNAAHAAPRSDGSVQGEQTSEATHDELPRRRDPRRN